MRASTIAISTLAALMTQELASTGGVPSNPGLSVSDAKEPDAVNPTTETAEAIEAVVAIALPETLTPQSLAEGRVGAVVEFSSVAKSNAAQLASTLKPPKSLDLVAIPSLPSVSPPLSLKPPSAPLPIDDIIQVSLLGTGNAATPKAIAAPERTNTPAISKTSSLTPGTFQDIQGHWAQQAIEELTARKIIRGLPDGRFHPDERVTASQFATLVQAAFPGRFLPGEVQQLPTQVESRAEAAVWIHQALGREQQRNAVVPTQRPEAASNVNLPVANLVASATGSGVVAAQPVAALNLPVEPSATPVTLTPLDEEYTLGAGDRLRVDVFNVPEYSGDHPVLVNGALNLPLVGNVFVKGMTLRQAGDVVARRYAPLLKRSLVTVSLVTPRPLNVAIAGEINRPGSYTISLTDATKVPTLTKAVQLAGGLTQAANLRQIQIRRPQRSGNDQIIRLDLWALLNAGDLRQDLPLRDGDTILIPAVTEVNLADASQLAAANFAADPALPVNIAIVGEVFRPGPYTLSQTTKEGKPAGLPTVTQAIQQAGGITQLADLRQVQVRRSTRAGAEQTINVNLWQLLQAGDLRQDLALQPGDTVVIPAAATPNSAEASRLAAASFSPGSIKVNVVGEVKQPGAIEVAPNTPLNQAVLSAGGFTNRARKTSVELIRLNPNGTVSRQAVAIDFGTGINEKNNPLLRNNDIIVVGRSGSAKFSDTLDKVLSPLGRLLPFVFLF